MRDAHGRHLHQHRCPDDDEKHQAGEIQRQGAAQRIAARATQGDAATHAVATRVGLELGHDLEQAAALALTKFGTTHGCSRLARPSVSSATASLVAATCPATLGVGAGLRIRKLRTAERLGRLNSTAAWARSSSVPEASRSRRWMLTARTALASAEMAPPSGYTLLLGRRCARPSTMTRLSIAPSGSPHQSLAM